MAKPTKAPSFVATELRLTVVLCHNTTVSSWYTNWWCWRNSPCLTWGRYGDEALLFNGRMGRKTRGSRNCKSQTLIFAKQFLRPRQSGAHGTCHACHTLDTPLATSMSCRTQYGSQINILGGAK